MAITNATLAQALNDLIEYWSSFNTEYATWLAGTVGGGPNLDGDYPLTDYEGNTTLVACPAQLEDDVSNLVTGAAGHKTAAEVAQTAAEVAQAAAELAETGSEAARDSALAYRDAALAAQTAAESARTTAIAQAAAALASQGYAEEWAITVEDTLVSVAAGGNGTTDYSSLHHAAKSAASAAAALASETAAAASESAAAASAAAAATFDPVLYAALADNETVTGQYTFSHASGILIGAAPLTAALIGQWNTAYGWGDHAGLYSLLGHTHVAGDILSVNTNKLLGRSTAGVGAAEELAVGQALSLTAGSLAVDLGTGGGQAAAGNHTHAGVYEPVDATILRTEDDATLNTLLLTPDTTTDSWGFRLESSNSALNDSGFWATANQWRLLLRDAAGNIGVDLHPGGTSIFSNTLSVGGQTVSGTKVQNWDTAHGWGDHSTAGYVSFGFAPASTPVNYVYLNRDTTNPALYVLKDSATGYPAIRAGAGTLGTTTFTEYVDIGEPGNHITMYGPAPKLKWNETDGALNEKIWDIVPVSGLLRFRCLNDADATSTDWLNVNRAGESPDLIHFMNTDNVQVNNRYVVTGALDGTSYHGLHVNGSDTGWIRTTTTGFLPHSNGASALGTYYWQWSNVYANYLHASEAFRADNASIEGSSGAFGSDVLHWGLAMRGGGFDATASSYTGYCRIGFPVGTTNDSNMMTMMIHGYNYSGTNGDGDGGAWCIQVSGYFYSSENWNHTSARIVSGSPPFDRVWFGESETADRKYILLGTTTTNWNYPKVFLTDFTAGHSTQDDWTSGDFNIDFSASTPSGWAQDSTSGLIYLGGQLRWDGEGSSNAASKNLGGRITISTSAASGGQDGDIHFKY